MTFEFLGRGPFAVVNATTVSGHPVAEKTFDKSFDRRTLSVIKRDRDKLAQLAATLPILPSGPPELRDKKHLVRMELCAESLTARVRRTGALEVGEVLELGYGLARALTAAHASGVPHGGVSPNNVLYRRSGQAVLSDFGVAIRQAVPRRDPLHGIEWMSPETLQSGVLDERADVYGLGTLLYFALTGDSPYPKRIGESPLDRISRVFNEPIPAISRPDVPIELSTEVARMLAPAAAHRTDKAATVVAKLGRMLSRTDPGPPSPVHARRPWIPYAVGGGVLAVSAAAVLWFLLPDADQPAPRAAAPQAPVTLDLADPVDQGSQIMLSWESSRALDVTVVVMPDGGKPDYQQASRETSAKVAVDPTRKYCFKVRGTNAGVAQIYESKAKPVRGAVCR
ncbi:serine/threonine protein kinase [Kibdelosporangium phytohabitans]|nr:protein kinase [Kibdelosporangium phytohabitans]MBE1468323.1 serine/threonine protein kinase [Kibdelosporangium phytohabitans]